MLLPSLQVLPLADGPPQQGDGHGDSGIQESGAAVVVSSHFSSRGNFPLMSAFFEGLSLLPYALVLQDLSRERPSDMIWDTAKKCPTHSSSLCPGQKPRTRLQRNLHFSNWPCQRFHAYLLTPANLQADDVTVLEKYCGAAGFLSSLGISLGIYLENLATSFPNEQNMDTSQLYTFIEVLAPEETAPVLEIVSGLRFTAVSQQGYCSPFVFGEELLS